LMMVYVESVERSLPDQQKYELAMSNNLAQTGAQQKMSE